MKKVIITVILMAAFLAPVKSQGLEINLDFKSSKKKKIRAWDTIETPISNRLSLIVFPLETQVGLAYCAGKKGQFKIENYFVPAFYEKPFRAHYVSDELRLLYAWKSCRHNKLYAGAGIKCEKMYHDPANAYYVFYGSIVPFGIEWFPFRRVHKFGMIGEATLAASGPALRIGLSLHL